jgi:hypothetical protein
MANFESGTGFSRILIWEDVTIKHQWMNMITKQDFEWTGCENIPFDRNLSGMCQMQLKRVQLLSATLWSLDCILMRSLNLNAFMIESTAFTRFKPPRRWKVSQSPNCLWSIHIETTNLENHPGDSANDNNWMKSSQVNVWLFRQQSMPWCSLLMGFTFSSFLWQRKCQGNQNRRKWKSYHCESHSQSISIINLPTTQNIDTDRKIRLESTVARKFTFCHLNLSQNRWWYQLKSEMILSIKNSFSETISLIRDNQPLDFTATILMTYLDSFSEKSEIQTDDSSIEIDDHMKSWLCGWKFNCWIRFGRS